MKKIIYVYLIFLFTTACAVQPQPTQDVVAIVSSTLTAIVQQQPMPQMITSQPQPDITSTPPPLPAPPSTGNDQTSVHIQRIELQQGAQACTANAMYIISAKVTGAANTNASYIVNSNNNGTLFADGTTIGSEAAITLDNSGEGEFIAGIQPPFSDPGNLQITVTVLINGQAVNDVSALICQGGEYKQ